MKLIEVDSNSDDVNQAMYTVIWGWINDLYCSSDDMKKRSVEYREEFNERSNSKKTATLAML